MKRVNRRPLDRVHNSEGSQRHPQDEILTSEYLDTLVEDAAGSRGKGSLHISSNEKRYYEDEMKKRCGLASATKTGSSRQSLRNWGADNKRKQGSDSDIALEDKKRKTPPKCKIKDVSDDIGKSTIKRRNGSNTQQPSVQTSNQQETIEPDNLTSRGKKETSKHVEPREQRSKKDHFRNDTITTQDLQYLLTQTPDDTVMMMQENFTKFSKLFSKSSLPKEESKLLLKIIAVGCKAKRSTQHLLQILCEFKDSQFITSAIRSLVGELDISCESDCLIDIAVLLQSIAFHFPSSFIVIFGLSNLVEGYANSVDDERFLKEWRCFNELKRTMLERQEKEEEKVRIQRERRLRPKDDFRKLSPFPNIDDVDFSCRAFLRKNKKRGGYEDDDDYLDTQFRLLKEDFVQPLRDGIKEHLERENDPKQRVSVKVYTNVQVCNVVWSNDRILHKLKFKVVGKKIVNWEYNKRLIFGTLLCLSMDNFKTFLLATVGDSDRKGLENGYVNVEFQTRYEDVESIKSTTMFTMLETPAYFEAYKHVLITLQKMREVPFSDYIVHCKTQCKEPRCMVGNNLDFEFLHRPPAVESAKKRRGEREYHKGYDPQEWPCKESLNLNEAQYHAFKEALTKEFCIVQGPPGTGKTFLGLKLVETLLANSDLWYKDEDKTSYPILLVCYTNHALDQFIEGVSKFTDAKSVNTIVRIGGQSNNSTAEKYLIKKRRVELFRKNELRAQRDNKSTLYKNLSTHQQKIAHCGWQIGVLRSGIVHEDVLKPFMGRHFPILVERFNKRDIFPAILNWLGVGNLVRQSKPDKNKKREDQSNETVHEYFDTNPDLLENKDKMFALTLDDLKPEEDKDEKQKTSEEEKPRKFNKLSKKKKVQLSHELSKKLQNMPEMNGGQYMSVHFIWHLSTHDRWTMYFYWLKQLKDFLLKKKQEDLKEHLSKFDDKVEEYEEATREIDYHILKKAKVIGMTTTGAAKNHDLLTKVNPRIVIIEEAAEVLESHTVSSLPRGCEHLILIGDHKQLKPNPNVYELARRYNLDLSMFERMVTNGHRPNTLTLQHRMRPSISRLMRHIYENLDDHPSVEDYPEVKGIGKNLFFINHKEKEKNGEDSLSHANDFEASYLTRLCKYLLLQGYEPSQITVLSTYLAQVGSIKKLVENMLKESHIKEEIHVTAVDNYQGEENDIILLSLVRSNDEDIVGFLKIENRICVALSRAKIGMYVIGNFDALQKRSELWKELIEDVSESEEFGEALPLYCQNHISDGGIMAKKAQDFDKAPDGGCTKKCEFRLNCGHVCHLKCHPLDKEHREYKCLKPCLRKCERGHPCKNKCHEDCSPCNVIISKELPCWHSQDGPCHLPPEEEICMNPCGRKCKNNHPCTKRCHEECSQCLVAIEKILPNCNHRQIGPCHIEPEEEKCMHPCDKICSLGHRCKNLCHEQCRPCTTIISKTIPACGHTQDGPCYLPPEEEKCMSPCEKKCENGHSCTNKCHEECSLCLVVIEKILPKCNHTQEGPCHIKPEDEKCEHPCDKTCSLGHRCQRLCHEDCGKCMVMVQKTLPNCGHEVSAHCHERPSKIKCYEQCNHVCKSGHKCAKKCHEYCGQCPVEVEKVLPRCGHNQLMKCSDKPSAVRCQTPCENVLSCGHTCRKLCKEPCTCKVFSLKRLKCGHDGRIPCGDKSKKDPDCSVPCKAKLTCGHDCKGSCKTCFGGRLHMKCEHTHECLLLCGHRGYLDGSWTSRCTKKCDFRCEHGSCKRKCMDRCTVMDCCVIQSTKPCDKHCENDTTHRCVGLLGYQCPDYCKDCCPDEYPKSLLGKKVYPNERYMQLKCEHIFPVEFLDDWMFSHPNQYGVQVVGYKYCIYCSTPIKDQIRYYQSVKQTNHDIDRIIQKTTQRSQKAEDDPDMLSQRITKYLYERLKRVRNLLKAFCSKEHHTREMSLARRDIKFLQGWLKKVNNITSQQQRDIEREITRLQLLVMLLWVIDSNETDDESDNDLEDERELNMAHLDLDDNPDFNEDDPEYNDEDPSDDLDFNGAVLERQRNRRCDGFNFVNNNLDDQGNRRPARREPLDGDIDDEEMEEEEEETLLNAEQMQAVNNAVRLLLRHGPLQPDVLQKMKKVFHTLPGIGHLDIEEVVVGESFNPQPLVFGCWFKCREGHLFFEGDPFNVPNPEAVACKECYIIYG